MVRRKSEIRQLDWRLNLTKMIRKGVSEVNESQIFEDVRRERKCGKYLRGTIVSLFEKETKVLGYFVLN